MIILFRSFSEDPIEGRRSIKDRIWLYFGIYDGPIDIPDRQSAGYEWIDLETLKKEFQISPAQFTDGLKWYVEMFGSEMGEFIKRYATKYNTCVLNGTHRIAFALTCEP